jgi:hypothetical protein
MHVRHRDEERGDHLRVAERVGSLGDDEAPEAVGDDHLRPRRAAQVAGERRHPLVADGSFPVPLLHPDRAREGGGPDRLPVLRPGVPDAGDEQHGRFHVPCLVPPARSRHATGPQAPTVFALFSADH